MYVFTLGNSNYNLVMAQNKLIAEWQLILNTRCHEAAAVMMPGEEAEHWCQPSIF